MQAKRRYMVTQDRTEEGRKKRQRWSEGEENERQMANNVMRRIIVVMGTWYALTLRRSPRQRRQKSFLLPLEHLHWFSLEEERVMKQSSVSISLSFWEPRYQSSRRPCASQLVPTQTNKNLTTNAIKGLSIPSWPLARVRSHRDDNTRINIFGIFMIEMQSKIKGNKNN